MIQDTPLIFEKNSPGRKRCTYTDNDFSLSCMDESLKRQSRPHLPQVSELEVIRHFTRLSQKNFSVDTHFYPLGSCTMKYNPRMIETAAAHEGFTGLHPLLSKTDHSCSSIQGGLEVIYQLEQNLCSICGMDAFTSQPMAGAHGEFTGILLVAAYHSSKGNKRKNIIVPDSSHGTNPASASMAGYDVITIPSLPDGEVDIGAFKEAIDEDTAAVMLTCPNTHGVFETRISEIADIAHKHDALLYYDGANLNAILGKIRPGDLGFDVVHINVHKTFSTPHGGGGPGAGPIGVKEKLIPFLPNPKINYDGSKYSLDAYPESIGKIAPFFGNFAILVRALAYIRKLGREGLIDVSEKSVCAANYIAAKLKKSFKLQFDRLCMHEAVFTVTDEQSEKHVKALDIAKFLIDKGVHAPTVYFPLTVKEAMMIEPTETEPLERLDEFIELMEEALCVIENDPSSLHDYPVNLPVTRPDETRAARQVDVRWRKK